ncbi:MAG: hypothetical protein Kapaf2KO_08170 [Candidatus Kapaibacteriales bacterium]
MLNKKEIQKLLNVFPEEFTMEDLIERLKLIEKIDRAESQSISKNTYTHEKVIEETEKWFSLSSEIKE